MGWNESVVRVYIGKKPQRDFLVMNDTFIEDFDKILDYIETLNTDKWTLDEHEVFDFDDAPQHTIRSGIQIVSY